MRQLLDRIGTRWVLIALAVAVVAFVAGVNYQLRTAGGILAQSSTPIPAPHSTPDMSKIVIPKNLPTVTVKRVISQEASAKGMTTARAEYIAAEYGTAIYLWHLDEVIRLPEDVQVGEKIIFPSCRLPDECPIAPLYPLTTGAITLWIDSRGIVFQENPDDIKAFPFLAGRTVANVE